MGFPAAMRSAHDDPRKLERYVEYLARRHGGRYMVWNLSEEQYDYAMLDNQVRGEGRRCGSRSGALMPWLLRR